jgi:hypothetical protein
MHSMFKSILLLALFAMASAFTPIGQASAAAPTQAEKAGKKIVANMVLAQTGAGTVQASWATNEAGPYQVSVFNLATGQRVQSFAVPNPNATVTGLTAGVKYLISAAGNVNFTFADILVL